MIIETILLILTIIVILSAFTMIMFIDEMIVFEICLIILSLATMSIYIIAILTEEKVDIERNGNYFHELINGS